MNRMYLTDFHVLMCSINGASENHFIIFIYDIIFSKKQYEKEGFLSCQPDIFCVSSIFIVVIPVCCTFWVCRSLSFQHVHELMEYWSCSNCGSCFFRMWFPQIQHLVPLQSILFLCLLLYQTCVKIIAKGGSWTDEYYITSYLKSYIKECWQRSQQDRIYKV